MKFPSHFFYLKRGGREMSIYLKDVFIDKNGINLEKKINAIKKIF